ncbi:putative aldehyde dehydrogenase [Platanthera guangdongensis]|uniref:Aldehyde dehydrogenase n=1 Tax=Platanthera guangdongensis TaxID=2320717 RepID=A0ABR2MJ06_9ASPA
MRRLGKRQRLQLVVQSTKKECHALLLSTFAGEGGSVNGSLGAIGESYRRLQTSGEGESKPTKARAEIGDRSSSERSSKKVRFLARSFGVPGNHLGQQSNGYLTRSSPDRPFCATHLRICSIWHPLPYANPFNLDLPPQLKSLPKQSDPTIPLCFSLWFLFGSPLFCRTSPDMLPYDTLLLSSCTVGEEDHGDEVFARGNKLAKMQEIPSASSTAPSPNVFVNLVDKPKSSILSAEVNLPCECGGEYMRYMQKEYSTSTFLKTYLI